MEVILLGTGGPRPDPRRMATTTLISLGEEHITIIMIEHIMQAVMRFSDRVMCLEAGKIIAIGAPAEVMANKRVQEAYLGT